MADVAGGAVRLNTGFSIPLIGLGTYKLLGEQVAPAVEAALEAGYGLFDTANAYENEAAIGDALAKWLPRRGLTREDIFITTKIVLPMGEYRETARARVSSSLKELRTTFLDLVLIHFPKHSARANDDPENAIARRETYQELEKMKEEGLIRSVGVSNYEVKHIEEISSFGKAPPAVNQVEFHPHFTREQLRAFCSAKGIFFQAFTSLARQHPDLLEDPDLSAIASHHSKSPQVPFKQILLAWALHCGAGIVPKSASLSRIFSNLREVVDIKLKEEEVALLLSKNRDQNYTKCEGWKVF